MDERQRDFLAVIGYVYLQHGDAVNAAAVLEAAHLSRPHDRDVVRLLAYAYLQMRRYKACLDLTDSLLDGNGQSESLVRLLRSRALLGLGRRTEARNLWQPTKQGDR